MATSQTPTSDKVLQMGARVQTNTNTALMEVVRTMSWVEELLHLVAVASYPPNSTHIKVRRRLLEVPTGQIMSFITTQVVDLTLRTIVSSNNSKLSLKKREETLKDLPVEMKDSKTLQIHLQGCL
jgi:hypothetical protein